MTVDESFTQPDLDALAFCVSLLQSEPDATYKEARREARVSKGLSVRRQVWTAARRKMGIGPQDEVVDASMPTALHSISENIRATEPSPEAAGVGEDEGAEEESGSPEGAWPSGRRPAWATPKPEQEGAAAPSPKDVFVDPPQNPVEFMMQFLQTTNPEASFEEVRLAAEAAGHTVYPATFGRAQALAGLLEEAEEGKLITPAASMSTAPDQAPPTAASPGKGIAPVTGLQAFIKAIAKSEKDHQLLRTNIEKMLETIRHGLRD
ncbi:MAG: hypothetical protein HRU14_07535 [Planctomycetes bacterium]|nr:hypothetical protein [Planctomycetota bacterium]